MNPARASIRAATSKAIVLLLPVLIANTVLGDLHYQSLKSFDGSSAGNPNSALVAVSDGKLYGTTALGGISNSGTVFSLSKDGSNLTILRSFGTDSDGVYPMGVIEGKNDGVLYGTTEFGGTNLNGTVFRMSKDGNGYRIIHAFGGPSEDGRFPFAGVIEGSDGALYGTTYGGGPSSVGTVFKLNKDGTGYRVLLNFNYQNGANPVAGLLLGSDSLLYGTTYMGGFSGFGTVFTLNQDGTGFAVLLHNFTGIGSPPQDGHYPNAAPLEGSDGFLYGTTRSGGTNFQGTIYKMSKDGNSYTLLHSFSSSRQGDGSEPAAALVEGTDGALYGTTTLGNILNFGTVFKIDKDGTGYELVYAFTGNYLFSDGANPFTALTLAENGSLYGTTYSGGASNAGTVFRLVTNRPPTITCPLPATMGGAGPAPPLFARVDDADGDPVTIVWSLNGTPVQTDQFAGYPGPPPHLPYPLVAYHGPRPLGTNLLEVTVTDSATNSASCSTTFTVLSSPPSLSSLSAEPSVLWPPNHKFVDVQVRAVATGFGGSATWKIISVSGDDGSSASDWQITGDHTLKLRAERSGKDDGRTYTITVQTTGSSGNLSVLSTVTVSVPHSPGKGK